MMFRSVGRRVMNSGKLGQWKGWSHFLGVPPGSSNEAGNQLGTAWEPAGLETAPRPVHVVSLAQG